MKNPFKNRTCYSLMALLLLYIGESIAFAGINYYVTGWKSWCYYILFFIILLWFGGIFAKKKFGIRSKILTKLLANAIAPNRLGVLYLFSFVIHIGWLTNVVRDLFMPQDSLGDIITNVVVCVLGMIVLIIFFPEGKKEKNSHSTKVFFSGISAVNYSIRNLTPLIRILQLTADDNEECEMLILYSNYYSKSDKTEYIEKNLGQYVENILINLKEDEEPKKVKELYDNTSAIKDKLKLVIKYCAMIEFPQKKWIARNLKVTFTDEEAEYDKFDNCYHIIEKYVKSKDDDNHEMYFNLTPGTGTVGALMTLMAIDGSRKLYYYIPENDAEKAIEESEEKKSERLKEVDKNSIPLESLLSQALDSII